MPYILSSGIQTAEFCYTQQELQSFVEQIFPMTSHEKQRLMPIFENTCIDKRQLAIDLSWFKNSHSFPERNDLFQNKAIQYSKQAISNCLSHEEFLTDSVSPADIDHILFISSTGIATPTLDAYIINDLKFKESIKRSPIFGLGCAGGTSGVARGLEWLKGHPDKNVLVVCLELCSLTFQLNDRSLSNFVGTALFGDGASAVLIAGDESLLLSKRRSSIARVDYSSSRIKRDSSTVMGWRVVETGFEVIFKKSIPRLVKEFWSAHAKSVLEERGWDISELPFLIAHPGGRKVIEAYEETMKLDSTVLAHTKKILREHGNMSSPTVHYVLHEAMLARPDAGTKSLMTSLGPGFSSEIVSMEWS
ncbi:3-oxoacyl-[acyl-carrier-protein] synthase III C-terminal domain-containing protein [Halobacillus rhizosphaerae]|uniref:type III polyketide synthase n=1 Tax=Halobacillus rhizosphaerae TaxID=3064889 RepID=UPI00398A8129